ncbi:hypothetical protein ACQZV8_15500 [Magnetococcales bacterium HHB-1]
MELSEMLEHYNNLGKKLDKVMGGRAPQKEGSLLTPLKLASLKKIDPVKCARPEEVFTEVKQFQPVEGWFTLPSKVVCLQKSESLEEKISQIGEKKLLLYGEFSKGENDSIAIHFLGAKGWIIHHHKQQEGDELLVQNWRFRSVEKDLKYLNYQVYWGNNSEKEKNEGYRRQRSRFTGFTPRNNKASVHGVKNSE